MEHSDDPGWGYWALAAGAADRKAEEYDAAAEDATDPESRLQYEEQAGKWTADADQLAARAVAAREADPGDDPGWGYWKLAAKSAYRTAAEYEAAAEETADPNLKDQYRERAGKCRVDADQLAARAVERGG